jgi:hypothetical protein
MASMGALAGGLRAAPPPALLGPKATGALRWRLAPPTRAASLPRRALAGAVNKQVVEASAAEAEFSEVRFRTLHTCFRVSA